MKLKKTQKNNPEFIFVGNRKFVLVEMLRLGLPIKEVIAVEQSNLHRQATELGISPLLVSKKSELLDILLNESFDVLISNGCPFLLPTTGYNNLNPVLVNIHPSLLPDLGGKDPVPGSVLNKRTSGATCHIIDDGVDTGPIISQSIIPYTNDLDVGILYQLSFLAEKKVFVEALELGFEPQRKQKKTGDEIYYSRSSADQKLNFVNDSVDDILNKVKAFGNLSQGVRMDINGFNFLVYSAKELHNPSLMEHARSFENNQIIFCYDDVIIIKKDAKVLMLKSVSGPLKHLKVGTRVAH